VNATHQYEVPSEQLSLSGPVVHPDAGQLPMRGDLAHIALAHRYLVAHYVVPQLRKLAQEAPLRAAPLPDAETTATFEAGQEFELLDVAGDWAWGCLGPEGPSGYLPLSALEE